MHIMSTLFIGCFTCMSGEGEVTSYAAGMAILFMLIIPPICIYRNIQVYEVPFKV